MNIKKTSPILFSAVLFAALLGGCHKVGSPSANQEQPATSPDQSAQQVPDNTPVPPPPPGSAPATAPQDQSGAATSSAPAAAPSSSATTAAPAPVQPAAPQALEIPAGTRIRVRLAQALGSKISRAGEGFNATVASPVVVDGTTVIPAGAAASGVVVVAKSQGRFKGSGELAIRLDSVRTVGGTYHVSTSTVERAVKGKGKRTAGFIGGGTGLGAILGGIAGGGKGALIGGLVGAGAGTAGTAFTGNKNIVIPAESVLTFRLERAVSISQ